MRTLVGAVVLVGMLALTGCVQGDPIPTLPPTPTSTPLFASEEEALAAAEEAYAAYNEVSSKITMDGGADPERIAPLVTADQLAREVEGAAFYSERGYRTLGSPVVKTLELQQWTEADGVAEVVVYVCLDVSPVRIVDADDRDVTPTDRSPIVSLEVVFLGSTPDELLVESSELWPDSSLCSQ